MSTPIGSSSERELAAGLNHNCFCITLNRDALADALRSAAGDPKFYAAHVASRPHLFSGVPVFLPEADRGRMMSVVKAIESVASTAAYKEVVLGWAPDIARHDFGPRGALMGYDFHLGSGPPRLIEINTNAGGAFLNAFAARAQLACCSPVEPFRRDSAAGAFDTNVIEMFTAEWRLQRGEKRPRLAAIVDDDPETQYLFPEFVLARRLFEASGMDAVIADPADLSYVDGKLMVGGRVIDLVYNRLVDFALTEERHAALHAAYRDGAVVLTPNPHNHALLADKRNLTVLSDMARLGGWKLPAPVLEALAYLPRSLRVTSGNADQLWTDRRQFFFKPASGHGSKAVYRGDKLTRSVWAAILEADYIAQELAAPGERRIMRGGALQTLKVDVRLYTYNGALLLAAARLYQGQTTNFRTEGGGFAPVFFV